MTTILITGANTGIGAAAALQLARPGTHLVLACRSEEKTAPVLAQIREAGAEASFLHVDLADLAATSAAAEGFAARAKRLDLLINNAGLGGQKGLTKDGFELAFGVNHLGHFALTLPLLPLLERAGGRVVNVSSGNHYKATSVPWRRLREPTASVSGLPEYGVSKLCNVLFTADLRRRTRRITAVSMNPGRIASDIWRQVPSPLRYPLRVLLRMESVEVGGERLAHASRVNLSSADAPLYIHKLAARAPNPLAHSEELARELWRYSLDALTAAIEEGASCRAEAPKRARSGVKPVKPEGSPRSGVKPEASPRSAVKPEGALAPRSSDGATA
jgi:retinol dehydrogenase 12